MVGAIFRSPRPPANNVTGTRASKDRPYHPRHLLFQINGVKALSMKDKGMKREIQADDIWLGLDVGTQSVRAIAVSGAGEILSANSQRLTSQHDGPRHEQMPEDWWKALAAACRGALTDLPLQAIRGVAVDSTSGKILLMDHQGRPLTPGLMHDD